MIKRVILFIMAAALILLAAACGQPAGSTASAGPQKYSAEFLELFDTVTQIVGYADSEAAFAEQAQQIKDDLETYHQLFDIYHSYPGITNLKDVNDRAGQGPVVVDRKIIDLLLYAQDAYSLTGGKVNVAMGSVLSIWHDYREAGLNDPENAEVPPQEILQEASRHTDIDDLVINEEQSTVEITDPDMLLDVGAVAKGYATEQVTRAAEARGLKHIMMSVGGNVRAVGYRNEQLDPWRAGIQNPESDNGDYLAILNVHDMSVVTSGSYERFYEVDGRRYHHIIDPVTLYPEDRFLSVTIVTRDSGLADILSTALFCMSYEDGLALIDSLKGTEALWCMPDGSLRESQGFAAYRADE